MAAVIKYVAGDWEYSFYVEVNAAKTLTEFCEHEKHHNLTKEQLKEVYGLIKKEAKKSDEKQEAKKMDEKPVE